MLKTGYKNIEKILFFPKGVDWFFISLLSPFSLIYCGFVFLISLKKSLKKLRFKTPILGVSNIVLGGSGKTPLVIALAKNYKKVAIINRGYGRKTKGLIIVSEFGKILKSVDEVGDEAYLFAKKIKNGIIIVSENREKAIIEAEKYQVDIIILDDSYGQHHIVKKEILIQTDIKNPFCLPAGGYREKLWFFKKDIIFIQDGKDFERVVTLKNKTNNMVLITAISKGERLKPFLPKNIKGEFYFPDHYDFSKQEIEKIFYSSDYDSILTTEKDSVKLEKFNFPLSILELNLKLKFKF